MGFTFFWCETGLQHREGIHYMKAACVLRDSNLQNVGNAFNAKNIMFRQPVMIGLECCWSCLLIYMKNGGDTYEI